MHYRSKTSTSQKLRRPKIDLLNKFSHAFWVLKYYGNYYDCEKLMKWLNTKSRIVWGIVHKSLINNGRRELKYTKPFDEDIANFLLPENYKKYSLSVVVDSLESGQALMKFTQEVPEFYELRFTCIQWELEEDSP